MLTDDNNPSRVKFGKVLIKHLHKNADIRKCDMFISFLQVNFSKVYPIPCKFSSPLQVSIVRSTYYGSESQMCTLNLLNTILEKISIILLIHKIFGVQASYFNGASDNNLWEA